MIVTVVLLSGSRGAELFGLSEQEKPAQFTVEKTAAAAPTSTAGARRAEATCERVLKNGQACVVCGRGLYQLSKGCVPCRLGPSGAVLAVDKAPKMHDGFIVHGEGKNFVMVIRNF